MPTLDGAARCVVGYVECGGGVHPGAVPQPVPQRPSVCFVFGVCVCLLLVRFMRGKVA